MMKKRKKKKKNAEIAKGLRSMLGDEKYDELKILARALRSGDLTSSSFLRRCAEDLRVTPQSLQQELERNVNNSIYLIVSQISLVIASIFDIIPGIIHFLAVDGGANSIAGIVIEWENATNIQVHDETWNTSDYHKQTVLVMFGALGLVQIKIGIIVSLLVLWLPEGNHRLLYHLTLILMTFQLFKIIVDLFEYRNIHSIASTAPGRYKPVVLVLFYVIAAISQRTWHCRRNSTITTTSTTTTTKKKI